MEQDDKFKFDGVMSFLTIFKSELRSRKCVAQFDNYEMAKGDIIMELCVHNSHIDPEMLNNILNHMGAICDIEEYFNEL